MKDNEEFGCGGRRPFVTKLGTVVGERGTVGHGRGDWEDGFQTYVDVRLKMELLY